MNNMIFTGFNKKNLCPRGDSLPLPSSPPHAPSKRFCTIIVITVGDTVPELCVVSLFHQ